jgi:hypothetical protein
VSTVELGLLADFHSSIEHIKLSGINKQLNMTTIKLLLIQCKVKLLKTWDQLERTPTISSSSFLPEVPLLRCMTSFSRNSLSPLPLPAGP